MAYAQRAMFGEPAEAQNAMIKDYQEQLDKAVEPYQCANGDQCRGRQEQMATGLKNIANTEKLYRSYK